MEEMKRALAHMINEHGISLVLSSLADTIIEQNDDCDEVNETAEKISELAAETWNLKVLN